MPNHLTAGVQPDPMIARLISEVSALEEFLTSFDIDEMELAIEDERRAASRFVEAL